MLKLFVALNCIAFAASGLLSIAMTVTTFVAGPCVSEGVQLITPVAGLMLIPGGGESRENVIEFVGRSLSVAFTVTAIGASSSMDWFSGTASVGGLLISRTTIVKELVVLNCFSLNACGLSSVTTTNTKLVEGP